MKINLNIKLILTEYQAFLYTEYAQLINISMTFQQVF